MTTIPIYILAGQSNASYAGVDAALVQALSASGGAYELVKWAIPGSQLSPDDRSIGDWSPLSGGELFDKLVQEVRERVAHVISQGFEPVISTIYWIQGEADGRSPTTANAYAANLEQFIAALREEISAPDAPFVISMLSTQSNSPHRDIIRDAQTQLAELENVAAVDTSDLQFLDGLHYTLLSRFELGARLVAAGEVLGHDAEGYVSLTSSRTIIAGSATIALTGGLDGDTLIGNALGNRITTGFGSNLVEARDGGDTVNGGFGNDTVFGGEGNDALYGSRDYEAHLGAYSSGTEWNIDADVLWGEGGNDIIAAGIGDDQLVGGTGNDELRGEIGDDWLMGDDGDDILDGGFGADTMRGGLGNDSYVVDDLGDVVIETGAGTDAISSSINISLEDVRRITGDVEDVTLTGAATSATGNALANTLTGNALDNALRGGQGNDVLFGDVGLDTLIGGAGEDRLDGGAGADLMTGGSGSDIYYVDSADDVFVELTAGYGTSDTVYTSVDLELSADQGIEILRAADGAPGLKLTGNKFADQIIGGAGNDTLSGIGRDEVLEGIDTDTLRGAGGDDLYYVDYARDTVLEAAGEGSDRVTASVSYQLAEGSEIELLTTASIDGVTSINLTGNEFGQQLVGNAGDNVLNGRGGADHMTGRGGNDIYIVDDVGDIVSELADANGMTYGIDTVRSSISHSLRANVETLILTGTDATNGTGNILANLIYGNAGANVIDGGRGADTMRGFAGDDTYVVDDAADLITEGTDGGIDLVNSFVSITLSKNVENTTLLGSSPVDAIGNGLANTMVGNDGDNRLSGGAGNDVLSGGAGRDTFVFDSAPKPSNVDHVVDFHSGDVIEIRALAFPSLSPGSLPGDAFKDLSSGTADADDRIIYDGDSGQLFYDANGSGAGLRVLVAVFDNQAALTSGDFIVA